MTGDFDGLVAAVTGDLHDPGEHLPHTLAVRTDVSDDTSVRAAIEQDLRLRPRG